MSETKPLITKVHEVAGLGPQMPGGKIFEICINRPEVHNAINGETAKLFLQAWQQFRDNDDLTVCVLRGAGKALSAGADLTALESLVNMYAGEEEVEEVVKNGTGPMGGTRVVQLKPVITVSQGYTYAGGLELFCHGHIRIAEKQAMFSVACRRWGVPLVDGGTVFLPRLLGWGAALPLILTGQRIRAKRAHEIGLVWEITPKGKGFERAMRIAEQLCQMPRDAMMMDLRSALLGTHLPLEEALRLEARNLFTVGRSESMKEGVARFNRGERFWFR